MMFKNQKNIFFQGWRELDQEDRRIVWRLAFLGFLLFLTYPLVRSSTTALFLELHGAARTPLVWVYSLVALSFSIFLYNKFQQIYGIKKLFLATCLITLLFFGAGLLGISAGQTAWAYFLYVWKEVYIILLVHMMLGHLNVSISEAAAKLVYGPFGAIGSLGGVLGGVSTSYLASAGGMNVSGILLLGCVFIALSAFLFSRLGERNCLSAAGEDEKRERPLKAIGQHLPFVLSLCLVVIMTQFCINLTNFRFNVLFDAMISGEREKTAYLGGIYASMNALSLVVQLFCVPLLLRHFRLGSVHSVIPIIYFALIFVGMWGPFSTLFLLSFAFVGVKGLDYSLFAAAKELLYFTLNSREKYGAKYLVDMFSYRFGKGLISFLLIFNQSAKFVNTMLGLSLAIWALALIPLFKFRPRSR